MAEWACPPDLHSSPDLPWATVYLVRDVTVNRTDLSWAAVRKHETCPGARCEAAGRTKARVGGGCAPAADLACCLPHKWELKAEKIGTIWAKPSGPP